MSHDVTWHVPALSFSPVIGYYQRWSFVIGRALIAWPIHTNSYLVISLKLTAIRRITIDLYEDTYPII